MAPSFRPNQRCLGSCEWDVLQWSNCPEPLALPLRLKTEPVAPFNHQINDVPELRYRSLNLFSVLLVQDRVTALLPLAPSTTWQAFQQQLMVWLGLPAGSFQVMLACSRASDREQVQKIPVHEGTVSLPCTLNEPVCATGTIFWARLLLQDMLITGWKG